MNKNSYIDKIKNNNSLTNLLTINVGIFLVALGIHFFRNPNKFSLGGVTALSLVFSYYFPNFAIGSLMMVLNILILILGYILLGANVGRKSFYGSFMLSGMVWLMEIVVPIDSPITNQKFLELMYGVFLPGIGAALVFSRGATTGGTDIVAKIITKYTNIKVSISLTVTDLSIAIASGLLYGAESLLFSIFGIFLRMFVMDSLLEALNIFKIMVIMTDESDCVKDFICSDLSRGATVHLAKGAFTGNKKEVITTVLDRKQAKRLQDFIYSKDPKAFITISNSSKIIGNGFNRFE